MNGRSFRHGTLEVITLEDLRRRSPALVRAEGNIRVREFVGDVRDMHEFAAAHALFQVASQFNLLEMVHPVVTPEMGVGRYEYDLTQGPACAIACGAGTVYRNYFVPINGRTGQSEDHQIDCLDLLGQALENDESLLWQMRNGYALANENGLAHIAKVLCELDDAGREHLKGLLRIGVQWDMEVTLADQGPVVSQAFCSALPVAYTNIAAAHWEPFARLVLEAAYEAALHAAHINHHERGCNIAYLTMLGGGAFGNPQKWILDALDKALLKFRQVPLDVRIVSYGASNPALAERIRAYSVSEQ